jgi:transposase
MAWRAVRDKHWKLIEAQLPKHTPDTRGGRPPLSDRQCFEGILWILWIGAPWSELPARYSSKSGVPPPPLGMGCKRSPLERMACFPGPTE